jgi:hypothetical protein
MVHDHPRAACCDGDRLLPVLQRLPVLALAAIDGSQTKRIGARVGHPRSIWPFANSLGTYCLVASLPCDTPNLVMETPMPDAPPAARQKNALIFGTAQTLAKLSGTAATQVSPVGSEVGGLVDGLLMAIRIVFSWRQSRPPKTRR